MSQGDIEQQAGAEQQPEPALPSAEQAAPAGPDPKDLSHDEGDADGAAAAPAGSPRGAAAPAAAPAFDAPFAFPVAPLLWYQDALLLLLLGGALGAFAYSYLKAITEVTDLWLAADGTGYPAPPALGFGGGRPWWIGLCGGAGLAVGLAKAALRLDAAPSFIDELRSMHTHLGSSLKVAAVALLGLLGGAPMGPEAGLGAAAGGAGLLLARLRGFRLQAERREQLYVLSSMCSIFSGLMPNAMTAVLLVLELGRPMQLAAGMTFMGLVCMLAAGATAAFVVYYAIAGYPYIDPLVTGLSTFSFNFYDQMGILEGMLFGIMGAVLAGTYLLIAGATKATVGSARAWLRARIGHWPCIVALTTAGGAAFGALGWAMPLTLTDGAAQLTPVLFQSGQVGTNVLAASCFSKMLGYHIAAECGFHGGLFLPMLAMSSMLGGVFINVTGVNPTVARSCAMVALGSALVPSPFALAVLSMSALSVGPQGLVPIFATACTAYLLCLGVGWPQYLVARAERQAATKEAERGER